MSNQQKENQCAHPGCSCLAPKGEDYCSPHCETAPSEAICGCGHADCVANVKRAAAPATA